MPGIENLDRRERVSPIAAPILPDPESSKSKFSKSVAPVTSSSVAPEPLRVTGHIIQRWQSGCIILRMNELSKESVTFLEVGEDGAGQRIDNFLLKRLKGVPKSHVYRILRSGEVRVNKGRAAADRRLELGDRVRVPPVRVAEKTSELPVPAREFSLVYEDESLVAIDKPAGVAVHGGSGVDFGVIEQLRRARPEARFLELAHRLDRETSGLLLIGKKRSALTRLHDLFRNGASTSAIWRW